MILYTKSKMNLKFSLIKYTQLSPIIRLTFWLTNVIPESESIRLPFTVIRESFFLCFWWVVVKNLVLLLQYVHNIF